MYRSYFYFQARERNIFLWPRNYTALSPHFAPRLIVAASCSDRILTWTCAMCSIHESKMQARWLDVYSKAHWPNLPFVALRGRLTQDLPTGAMLSVSLSEQALRAELDARLSIAAINGPSECVVSGPQKNISALQLHLESRNIPRQ